MAVRVRRSIGQAESMIEALLTLAVSGQGALSAEFCDLATWAEDAVDSAAPEIERLNLSDDAAVYLEIANSGPFISDDAVPNSMGGCPIRWGAAAGRAVAGSR